MALSELRPLEAIQPYSKNAKLHPKAQVDKIAASIKEFGFNQPIVVNKDGVIIVGHGRYEAAKALNLATVPVLEVHLTDEQEKSYRLADNKLNESDWDMSLVIEELKGLSEPMIELTGFDKDLLIEPDEKDDIVPTDAPTRAKLGDVWLLGEHRVMCGDSTDKEAVERLLKDTRADLMLTDPPYGISVVGKDGHIGGGTKKIKVNDYRAVIGDDVDIDMTPLLDHARNSIIFGGNYLAYKLPKGGRWLVWDKDRNSGLTFSDCELAWTNVPGVVVKKYTVRWDGYSREGEKKEALHPTMKSVKLLSDILTDYSEAGQSVLDLFLGSGSTLIAAEKTGRICYGVELDPKYVDVILKRWEDYTGKEAILYGG